MVCYSSPRAELTCLRHAPRSDHRELSSESSSPVHKPPRLELSLLQQRDYLRALLAYVSVSQWVDVAQRTKHFLGDISPYLTGSVHVASPSTLERRCRSPFTFLTLFLFSPYFLREPGKPPRLQSLLEIRYFLPLNS